MKLGIMDWRCYLSALQIICGMEIYVMNWERDHIRVALLERNENASMKPREVINLRRSQNISSSKTKKDI